MTQFIREQRLLPQREIDRIIAEAPTQLLAFLDGAAAMPLHQRPTMGSWLARFNAGLATIDRPESAQVNDRQFALPKAA